MRSLSKVETGKMHIFFTIDMVLRDYKHEKSDTTIVFIDKNINLTGIYRSCCCCVCACLPWIECKTILCISSRLIRIFLLILSLISF